MKLLYLDCCNGAAGDMLSAALWELIDKKTEFLKEINSAGIPGVKVYALPDSKCGVAGTHFKVEINGIEEGHGDYAPTHKHSSLSDITDIINSLNVSEKAKKDAVNVYKLIAEAESIVHGEPVAEIHFHEVGAMDAIADVLAVSMLIEKLAPDCIIASPVHTGSGTVKCAHGILPIPAPATTLLLKGIPMYSTEVKGELCTPTGAALIKYFANKFGPLPVMNMENIGYGTGSKDFEIANYLRAVYGETDESIDSLFTSPAQTQMLITKKPHHPVNHSDEQKKTVLNRLSRTIGHLESVKRMVDDNRDASDVLIQLSAVQSSINSTARVIIKDHFKHSIENAVHSDDEAAVAKFNGLIDKFLK